MQMSRGPVVRPSTARRGRRRHAMLSAFRQSAADIDQQPSAPFSPPLVYSFPTDTPPPSRRGSPTPPMPLPPRIMTAGCELSMSAAPVTSPSSSKATTPTVRIHRSRRHLYPRPTSHTQSL